MKLFRTNAIAGALVFFEFLASQAIAAPPEPQTLDTGSCHHFGKIVVCPQFTPELKLSVEQFEAIQKAPKPAEGPEAPDSTKK